MNEQPNALEYAVSLDARGFEAEAAELRRLHAVNQELLEALRKCSAQLTRLGYSANHADAALVKVERQV